MAPFFNSVRNIYSLTTHIVGFLCFCLGYVGKISPQKSVTYEKLTVLKITEHDRKTTKFRAFSKRCSVYFRSLCSPNVNLKGCF